MRMRTRLRATKLGSQIMRMRNISKSRMWLKENNVRNLFMRISNVCIQVNNELNFHTGIDLRSDFICHRLPIINNIACGDWSCASKHLQFSWPSAVVIGKPLVLAQHFSLLKILVSFFCLCSFDFIKFNFIHIQISIHVLLLPCPKKTLFQSSEPL